MAGDTRAQDTEEESLIRSLVDILSLFGMTTGLREGLRLCLSSPPQAEASAEDPTRPRPKAGKGARPHILNFNL